MSLTVVMACELLPTDHTGPSVFLAGPTPRLDTVPSWRPDAIAELDRQWTGPDLPELTVYSPESRAAHYDDQVDWETDARERASAILFWIPRDLVHLPGMTTNVEFGLDVTTGRAVLGYPPDCPNPDRNRYLIWVAHRHGAPGRDTLPDTVTAALTLARNAFTTRWSPGLLKSAPGSAIIIPPHTPRPLYRATRAGRGAFSRSGPLRLSSTVRWPHTPPGGAATETVSQ
ncbi:nucleoside 2-deoxyribosyltransferase domain-containing protein [Streptomyces sp. NPDC059853]|uniref:nucleoside 2-deoxyribosyltransferase domain-containing protein n=1 Tax=Streptomyces sp. NPDC059853 TaxID=3346973 RepID=UPI0036575428